jgi:hypothetical protein
MPLVVFVVLLCGPMLGYTELSFFASVLLPSTLACTAGVAVVYAA